MNDAAEELKEAIEDGDLDLLASLIDSGTAARAAYDHDDPRPIEVAFEQADEGAALILLDAGLAQNRPGADPLLFSATWSAELVRRLISLGHGAAALSKDGHGLMVPCARQGDAETTRLLAAAGADVNTLLAPDSKRLSAAAVCADSDNYRGAEPLLPVLLELGADPLARDRDGRTLLHHAVGSGHRTWQNPAGFRINLQALLRAGVDIDAPDTSGQTALHLAAYRGKTELVRLLLEAGADTGLVNQWNRTPAEEALRTADGAHARGLLAAHEARERIASLTPARLNAPS